jgi:hypothetical protein
MKTKPSVTHSYDAGAGCENFGLQCSEAVIYTKDNCVLVGTLVLYSLFPALLVYVTD